MHIVHTIHALRMENPFSDWYLIFQFANVHTNSLPHNANALLCICVKRVRVSLSLHPLNLLSLVHSPRKMQFLPFIIRMRTNVFPLAVCSVLCCAVQCTLIKRVASSPQTHTRISYHACVHNIVC